MADTTPTLDGPRCSHGILIESLPDPHRCRELALAEQAWVRVEAALDFAMETGGLSLEDFQGIRHSVQAALGLPYDFEPTTNH